jgi:hypothetical protein
MICGPRVIRNLTGLMTNDRPKTSRLKQPPEIDAISHFFLSDEILSLKGQEPDLHRQAGYIYPPKKSSGYAHKDQTIDHSMMSSSILLALSALSQVLAADELDPPYHMVFYDSSEPDTPKWTIKEVDFNGDVPGPANPNTTVKGFVGQIDISSVGPHHYMEVTKDGGEPEGVSLC